MSDEVVTPELVDPTLPSDKSEIEQLLLAKEIEAARLEAEELRRQVELIEDRIVIMDDPV